MIHQVSGGAQGQATDILIQAKETQRMKDQLNDIMARHCGKTRKQLENDTERDNFLNPQEAKKYGLIDKVLTRRDELETKE